jgi:hypothetical protein
LLHPSAATALFGLPLQKPGEKALAPAAVLIPNILEIQSFGATDAVCACENAETRLARTTTAT